MCPVMVEAKTVAATNTGFSRLSLPLASNARATPRTTIDNACIQKNGIVVPWTDITSADSGSSEYQATSASGSATAIFLLPVNTSPASTADARSGTKSR